MMIGISNEVQIDDRQKSSKNNQKLEPIKETSLLEKAANELLVSIEQELDNSETLKNKNRNLSLFLGISGLLFSALATIFGVLGNIDKDSAPRVYWWNLLTPISATLAATSQAALLGYPLEKRASFYRSMSAHTKAMKIDLELQKNLGITTDNLKNVSDQLQKIIIQKATEESGSTDKISSQTLDQINEISEKLNKIHPQ